MIKIKSSNKKTKHRDGEVEAEYTEAGYLDMTEELLDAIKNNPVLEGWDNKLIHISAEK